MLNSRSRSRSRKVHAEDDRTTAVTIVLVRSEATHTHLDALAAHSLSSEFHASACAAVSGATSETYSSTALLHDRWVYT